jgi:hypothetical protein
MIERLRLRRIRGLGVCLGLAAGAWAGAAPRPCEARAFDALAVVAGDADDDGTGLTLRAHAADGSSSTAAQIGWLVSSIALLIAVASIGLVAWESPSDHLVGYLRTLGRGPEARGLYLPLHLAREDGGEAPSVAYLRELTPKSAGLLTEHPLVRGERVRLALGSLPGYPHPGATVPGVVTRVARFRSAEWVYARVRLIEASGPERQSVREFVEHLAHHAAGQPA